MPGRAWIALCAGAVALAGCGRPEGGAAPRIDDRTDPALAAALDDQILVDPTLSQYSNRTTVRTSERPGESFYPAVRDREEKLGCPGTPLQSGTDWARRLPAEMPLMAGARMLSGAGSAANKCLVVVANFEVAAAPAQVIDWYWPRATRSGLSATQLARGPDQALFGRQGARSYFLIASPRGQGSEVGLVFRTGD